MRMVSLVLAILATAGCASSGIALIGPMAATGVHCYSVKDRDLVIALGLIVCEKDGKVVASAGGAAPGVGHGIAPLIGSALLGAGIAVGAGMIELGTATTITAPVMVGP